jgi:predicted DsbA family dithiol-disulfide isomerase
MPELHIAIVSDVICPWCYLGKRRLERALDELNLLDRATFTWLPFELNPDMPPDGLERNAYRAAKFGAERGEALDKEMIARGESEGVTFAFDKQQRTPNTRNAHKLIARATEAGVAGPVVESLFRAYFQEGRDVGARDVLLDVAERAGLDKVSAAAALDDDGLREQVVDLERQAVQIGVSGVPFFIVNQTWAVSGAQPAKHWIEALNDILNRPVDVGAGQPGS